MDRKITLAEIIDRQTIACNVKAANRDEVADRLGELMVAAGVITAEYITAMKKVMDELGPYCVIAPGIALLHARPQDGVIKPCLGVITLKPPVTFNHSQNDPVEIAFGLGAVDKESHIAALAELANLLAQPEFIQALKTAQNENEIVKVFTERLENLKDKK
jgi:mannitol/fructose-specific phosphotransferase system IIA component (Ntr-type)